MSYGPHEFLPNAARYTRHQNMPMRRTSRRIFWQARRGLGQGPRCAWARWPYRRAHDASRPRARGALSSRLGACYGVGKTVLEAMLAQHVRLPVQILAQPARCLFHGGLLAEGVGFGVASRWQLDKSAPAEETAFTGPVRGDAGGANGRCWRLSACASERVAASGPPPGHTGEVLSVAVSADSRLLVSGGFNELVWLWHIGSGTCQRTLRSALNQEHRGIAGLTTFNRPTSF